MELQTEPHAPDYYVHPVSRVLFHFYISLLGVFTQLSRFNDLGLRVRPYRIELKFGGSKNSRIAVFECFVEIISRIRCATPTY